MPRTRSDRPERPFPHLTCADGLYCGTSGSCQSRVPVGGACMHDDECDTTWCDTTSPTSGACAARLPNGAACTFDGQCAAGACVMQACSAGAPITPEGCTPPPRRSAASQCDLRRPQFAARLVEHGPQCLSWLLSASTELMPRRGSRSADRRARGYPSACAMDSSAGGFARWIENRRFKIRLIVSPPARLEARAPWVGAGQRMKHGEFPKSRGH